VSGWVATTRSSGKIGFIVLRDGSGYLQAVLGKRDVPAEVWARFEGLTQETCIRV
jgi:asparaginyl-tRNA synthetase